MSLPPTFEARLARARTLGPGVRELVFERADGQPVDFQAGQWVSLILPLAGGEVRRSYSIASPPRKNASFEIAVTLVEQGPGSRFLHTLEPGQSLTAVGPQGFFTRTADAAPALFVGTGTGVTPLRSMMLDALAKGSRAPLWLIFGVRTEADRLYREEFDALAEGHPHVRIVYTLSRPSDTWSGLRGYVQTHVAGLWNEIAQLGGEPHAYICGLHDMVAGVRDVLRKELNVARQQVHSERYD